MAMKSLLIQLLSSHFVKTVLTFLEVLLKYCCLGKCMEEMLKKIRPQSVDNSSLVRVLVIEDHNLSAYIAERFLTDLGCQVDCVPDGKAALKHFRKGQASYDLVFMDVSLPDIDGYALAEQIKKTSAFQNSPEKEPIHIVALTARGGEENKKRCLSVGMSAVIVKPLLRTTAREILKEYVPKWVSLHPNHKAQSLQSIHWDIEGDPINFDYALTIHDGDINFIKGALQLVLDNLFVELKYLESECVAQHWDASRVIIHKLQGGTRYFGLVRLDQVCERFTKILHQNPIDYWREIYNVLVSEVEKVRCVYEEWLQGLQVSR